MPLSSGTRFGSYEVIRPLGAGGMGEVYLARDSQLKREVALKTLPSGVITDPDRLARFQREAEVLAALNHPNIAQIHGIADGQVTGVSMRALVMEFVDGQDLAQRLAGSGRLPVDEAMALAVQIAQALGYAHERGIVHRDLKPANIKLTPDGQVKVLDFGLAKAIDNRFTTAQSGSGSDPDNSPTIKLPAMVTQSGVILGTAAYMAPEQAKGQTADKRSDVWAFGCVLFEMLTATRAFAGDDATDSIVAVMTKEPEWGLLPPDTPPSIDRLLRRCLTKDRRRRLADIHDALIELEDTIANPQRDPTPASGAAAGVAAGRVAEPASNGQRARWVVLGMAVTLAITGAIAAVGWPMRSGTDERPLDLSFAHVEGGSVGSPHLSPDARKVAYRARRADGMPMIWVRDLADGQSRPIAGTEGALRPFWSDDSRDLGFIAPQGIKRVPIAGGPVQQVLQATMHAAYGVDWAGDTIVFAPSTDFGGLQAVAAAGGQPRTVTKTQGPDWVHLWPSFLPDGRRFLFTAKQWTRSTESSEQGVYVGSLNDGEVRRLLPDLTSAVYAPPGYLVFARDGKLTAAPFDARSATLTGEPQALEGADVAVDSELFLAGISAARTDSSLAVRPAPAELLTISTGAAQLQRIDRKGTRAPIGRAQVFDLMSIDREGRRVALSVTNTDATTDLAMLDLQSGISTPITTTRAWASWPAWADDNRLAYSFQPPDGLDDLYVRNLGTGEVTRLTQTVDVIERPIAWSRSGEYLIVDVESADRQGVDVYSMRTKELRPISRFGMSGRAAFSPDDRFVAFNSVESGRVEVHVTSFPDQKQTWQVTTDGGRVLSWSADGRELLVATLTGHLASYPVTTTPAFSAGAPTILVRDLGYNGDVTVAARDHSFFLVRTSADAARDRGEIRLLFGWTSRLGASRPR